MRNVNHYRGPLSACLAAVVVQGDILPTGSFIPLTSAIEQPSTATYRAKNSTARNVTFFFPPTAKP
jgi:hypothetical protein